MEELAIILVCGLMNAICFLAGAKVGQKVIKGEPIEIPKPDPVKAIREHNERKAAEMEQNRLDTILQNIDNYDGTSQGQKDVPRG